MPNHPYLVLFRKDWENQELLLVPSLAPGPEEALHAACQACRDQGVGDARYLAVFAAADIQAINEQFAVAAQASSKST